MVAITYLDALNLLRVIQTVNEAHRHVHVRLPFDIFGIPQHLTNYHSKNGSINEEFLVEFMRDKEPVQRLLRRNMYLKECHISSIIYGLVLPSVLWMTNIMVLLVDI